MAASFQFNLDGEISTCFGQLFKPDDDVRFCVHTNNIQAIIKHAINEGKEWLAPFFNAPGEALVAQSWDRH